MPGSFYFKGNIIDYFNCKGYNHHIIRVIKNAPVLEI